MASARTFEAGRRSAGRVAQRRAAAAASVVARRARHTAWLAALWCCTSAPGSPETIELPEAITFPPPGYTTITVRSFDSKAATRTDVAGAEGWEPNDEFDRPLFTIASDPSAPMSRPLVGQMRYPRGFIGGQEPALIDKVIVGDYTSIYIGLWVKLSSNWYGHPSTVNKVLFMWLSGQPKLILSADGEQLGRLRPAIRIQDAPDGTDTRLPNVRPGAEVVRGRWQRWDLLVDENVPGRANGRVRWWIDGALVSDWRDIALVAPGERTRWEIFQWAPTWGGVAGTLPADQYMWWDHVVVAGK